MADHTKDEALSESTLASIQTLQDWIRECPPKGMVFLGGAGVSTESGIPDFRSTSGLYNQEYSYRYKPETMISRSFFDAHPDEFFDFYIHRMVFTDAYPNQCHRKLAELERDGILSAVITQNIDGLHQAAGSKNVLELHGSIWRNYCMDCGAFYTLEQLQEASALSEDEVPHCPACGGIIKPDVVLYEEPLDSKVLRASIDAIRAADLMVIAGTSLAVYPAAGLMDYFDGSHLVIVNKTPTPQDRRADLCIAANVGRVFDF